ncbi:cytochrome c oxidase assembly protein [Radiobacillus sp. PE A8.2]|uniref:cytochrome c oxidase assembly protein n=1 Tax=Radiobacillus sp. PE A8.2 TaxID=3380349 RepID=UPI0038908440
MKSKKRFGILGLTLFFFAFLPLQTYAHDPEVRGNGDGNLFQHYTWFEILNPLLLLLLMLIYIVYLWTMRKISNRSLGERKFRKKLSFLLGLLTIYVSLAGPIAILSNNLILSAHMLQQSFMYIVMPPLILLGMPREFFQFLDERLFKPRFLRILKSPLLSLLLFNALWSFYHIPPIYEFFLEQFILLEILHIVLNTSAFLMWIQVLAPEDQINEMSYLKKIGYMFANGMLITPACALIIFAGDVIYPSILEAPQVFTWLTPLGDQQLGGIIMKVVQEFSYGAAIAYVFFKWARLERAKDAQIDELPSSAVE